MRAKEGGEGEKNGMDRLIWNGDGDRTREKVTLLLRIATGAEVRLWRRSWW
jgi:hypothetical protein